MNKKDQSSLRRALGRARRRSRSGGNVVEPILYAAAVLGCFVYPMSVAARAAGGAIAADSDSCYQTDLTQYSP